MIFKGSKMEFLFVFIGGLLLGGGSVFALTKTPKERSEDIGKGQIEIQKQLTNLDITKPLCSPNYIKEYGDRLCREITCLQFTRGIDSKTSGSHCESISNINNKIEIQKFCNTYQNDNKQDCLDLFWKRN